MTTGGSQLAGTDQHSKSHMVLEHCSDFNIPSFLPLDETEYTLSKKTHFDHELEIGVTPAGCGGQPVSNICSAVFFHPEYVP